MTRFGAYLDRPSIKDEAPCCAARRDSLGRLPIGYCGPDCLRRPRGHVRPGWPMAA